MLTLTKDGEIRGWIDECAAADILADRDLEVIDILKRPETRVASPEKITVEMIRAAHAALRGLNAMPRDPEQVVVFPDSWVRGWHKSDEIFSSPILISRIFDPPVSPNAILPDAMLPCGKKWYRSKAEAEGEMERGHMQSTRGPKFKLNAYYCGGCDGYHIGHTRIARGER